MSDMNFVPDDYVNTKETKRTNIFYIALFVLMMIGLGATFGVIKYRQSKLQAKEDAVDLKLQQAREELKQIEVMQSKRKELMNTALMASDLIEPVPRSVLLAAMTNCLPDEVSISNFELEMKPAKVKKSKYDKSKTKGKKKNAKTTKKIEPPMLSKLVIEGVSPTDIEVAEYIAALSVCEMFGDVELTKSEELEIDEVSYRKFELKTVIELDFTVTAEDVEQVRTGMFSLK